MTMEQVQRERGSMRRVSIDELEGYAQRWVDAEEACVQHWAAWEREAAEFFGVDPQAHGEIMHGVMDIVCAVCYGSVLVVKGVLRDATPSVLMLANQLFGHLLQCGPVIEAELRFRAGELARDWTLQHDGEGKVTIRSEFRPGKRGVTH